MKYGPDISPIAALIGNPACSHMLMSLMAGPALTMTELAEEVGLALPTVSGHLARLERAGLVAVERQGRHRYFRLASPDVAIAIEGIMPLAARAGHLRTRPGPREPELRYARSCYDHLAGNLAVKIFDDLMAKHVLDKRDDTLNLTQLGKRFFAKRGIEIDALSRAHRPLCRTCLDWSERRSHLAGQLGAAIFDAILSRGWAVRDRRSRIVRFAKGGESKITAWLSE
ncbi:MAG TPA: helix-turn-helix domain-containing protein [Xanthobacteraceae bacterium]